MTSVLSVIWRLALCVSTIGDDDGGKHAGEFNAFALERRKPRQRERHGVTAWTQVLDAVLPGAVGDRGADFFDQRRAARFDGDARQHGA
jgi:hypothetical protein